MKRCVKLVTEAPLAVCGEKSRDGFIRSRLQACLLMPVFNTKTEYRASESTQQWGVMTGFLKLDIIILCYVDEKVSLRP